MKLSSRHELRGRIAHKVSESTGLKVCEEKHLQKHRIHFSEAPLWSAVKSVLPSLHTPTVMVEEGLHRCVQIIHTNTALICAYNAPASKQRERLCVCDIYIFKRPEISGKLWIWRTCWLQLHESPSNLRNSTVKEHQCFLPSNGFTLTTWHYSSYTDGVQCHLMYA